MTRKKEINQCDGCRRGLPIENGIHRGPGGFLYGDVQYCTKDLYIKEDNGKDILLGHRDKRS